MKQPNDASSQDRLQILDLMRFIAAMSVVIYHMTYRPFVLGAEGVAALAGVQSFSKYGFLGVELFFLISGFVILWSASGRSAVSYTASRISRLVPSLWVSIGITCLFLVAFSRGAGLVEPKVIAANMTLIAGYIGLPYVDGVYWTLQAEIKFYVLVFALIVTRQMGRLEYWLVAWLCGLAVAHTTLAPGWLKSMVIFPYGSYFVGGSLFFLLWRDGVTKLRLVLLVISLCLSILCVRQESPGFMGNDDSLEAFIIASTLVVLQYVFFTCVALRKIHLPQSDWWFKLGALTYPLYLLHNQIGKAIAATTVGELGVFPALALQLLIPLVLAIVMSQTVEKKACPWLRKALTEKARKLGFAL